MIFGAGFSFSFFLGGADLARLSVTGAAGASLPFPAVAPLGAALPEVEFVTSASSSEGNNKSNRFVVPTP
jgi:hypothetical protein